MRWLTEPNRVRPSNRLFFHALPDLVILEIHVEDHIYGNAGVRRSLVEKTSADA